MSYIYLQEQEGGSWEECSSDTPQFVLWKLNPIADESCSNGNETASCQSSQSGMMSAPLTEPLGGEKSMSFAEGSLAKTLAVHGEVQDCKESEADSGEKWPESLAKYDLNTHSWRTHQGLLFEDSTESLEIFPRWGMTQGGELYPLECAAHLTEENASGSLPTPRAAVSRQKKFYIRKNAMVNLEELPSLPKYQHLSGKLINPEWMEWLMGWTIGWAALKPLEMDKFQLWRQQHLDFFQNQ